MFIQNLSGFHGTNVRDQQSRTFFKTTAIRISGKPVYIIILLNESTLSLAAIGASLRVQPTDVRLSLLQNIVSKFPKYPAKNPGLLHLDHFLTVQTASVR
jgi:hypothetical protein